MKEVIRQVEQGVFSDVPQVTRVKEIIRRPVSLFYHQILNTKGLFNIRQEKLFKTLILGK